jgi:anti-sigma regulatory factor (Ser/Thr protein kinase)
MAEKIVPLVPDRLQSVAVHMHYGHFMVMWACIDELLEVYIQRQTRMSGKHATIVLSGLGFARKASIARSLMSLSGDTYKPARTLLNKIIAEAERNALVHGLSLSVGNPLRFAKRSTQQKLEVKILEFGREKMRSRVRTITSMGIQLQAMLGITNADIARYDKMTRSLASKSAKSPKPPSS